MVIIPQISKICKRMFVLIKMNIFFSKYPEYASITAIFFIMESYNYEGIF